MLTLQPITPQAVIPFRDVRLRALQDAPLAFGSTYAKEKRLTDTDWQHRAAQWTTSNSVGYLTMQGSVAHGIAAGRIDHKTHLLSMWVAPEYRNRGVGKRLVTAIADWAQAHQIPALYLMVTSNNAIAIAFYQRLGFRLTGYAEPYPNDSILVEYEMMRPLSAPSRAQPKSEQHRS